MKSKIRIHTENSHFDYVNSLNKENYYEYTDFEKATGKGKIKTDFNYLKSQLKKKEGMLKFPKSDKKTLDSTDEILIQKTKNKNNFIGFRISEIKNIEII